MKYCVESGTSFRQARGLSPPDAACLLGTTVTTELEDRTLSGRVDASRVTNDCPVRSDMARTSVSLARQIALINQILSWAEYCMMDELLERFVCGMIQGP